MTIFSRKMGALDGRRFGLGRAVRGARGHARTVVETLAFGTQTLPGTLLAPQSRMDGLERHERKVETRDDDKAELRDLEKRVA